MKCLWMAVAFVTFGFTNESDAQMSIGHAQLTSFVNSPRIVAPMVLNYQGTLAIAFEAVFTNDCSADTGADAFFVDVSSDSETATSYTRIVLLHQRLNPEGCPDIFMPTSRDYLVLLRNAAKVSSLMFLDRVFASAEAEEGLPDSFSLKDVQIRDHSPEEVFDVVVAANPLFLNGHLPTLFDVSADRQASTRHRHRYQVSFALPASLPLPSLDVRVYESRGETTESQAASITHWLIVATTGSGETRSSPTRPSQDLSSYSLTLEIPDDLALELVIVNPSGMKTRSEQLPFAKLRLYP